MKIQQRGQRNRKAENAPQAAVRLNKRFPNRANRHRLRQLLQEAAGRPDMGKAVEVEERLARRRPKAWRKEPGLPLGDWVESRLQRRLRLEDDGRADERRLA
ncbi:hypothetical protein [Actinomadura sp. K4S16]|uniref:hypothetical protein n=1 Tax=Actinomadura sp. K4S16 TaxID=1316147 RepID=UPI0011EC376C|nr:hypothetical protein [Actinomadura sp. K4S16]